MFIYFIADRRGPLCMHFLYLNEQYSYIYIYIYIYIYTHIYIYIVIKDCLLKLQQSAQLEKQNNDGLRKNCYATQSFMIKCNHQAYI